MTTITFLLTFNGLLGLAAGFIMHRADFCLTGMFRDLFLFRAVFKLRILLLLIIVSMILFEAARLSGLSYYPFPLIASPSLTALVGGTIFGIGMVLAGGCVVGSLYKSGSGSVPSMVAVCGLIVGSALFAEIFPWWSRLVAAASIFKGKFTLAQALEISPLVPVAIAVGIALPWFLAVQRRHGWQRQTYTDGSLQPWVAAIALAGIGLLSAIVVGTPLGITSSYAKAAAMTEAAICPDHFAGVSFFKIMPLQYAQPFTGTMLRGGPGKELDAVALIQFPLVLGIVAGGALSTLLLKEFRIRWKLPLRQYVSAAAGGVLMGLASRMAAGCNVWHLLGGLPLLTMQSLLFLAGMVPGAWLGGRLFLRLSAL